MTDAPTPETGELLPCPFCDGLRGPPVPSSEMLGTAEELQMATNQWNHQVRCICGSGGPDRSTEAEAIAAWNTRAALSTAPRPAEPVAYRWRLDPDGAWSYGPELPGKFRFGDPVQIDALGLIAASPAQPEPALTPTPVDDNLAADGVGNADGVPSETDALVDRFAAALKEKLRAAEAKYGYDDAWMRPDWQPDLVRHLVEHLHKGDPRDVAAYCAFAHHHGWSVAPAPSEGVDTCSDEPIGDGEFIYRTTLMGERHLVHAATGFVWVKLPYDYRYTDNATQRATAERIIQFLRAPTDSGWRPSREAVKAAVMAATDDKFVADGWDDVGKANILIQGCRFARSGENVHRRTDGYANPAEAADNFAGFIADAILALTSDGEGGK